MSYEWRRTVPEKPLAFIRTYALLMSRYVLGMHE